MKTYYKVKENPAGITDIKVDTYYSLGGYSYVSYKAEPRGYYVMVTPVTRTVHNESWESESFTAFTGYKVLVKEVKRKSAKAESEAIELSRVIAKRLMDIVLEKQGLELEG